MTEMDEVKARLDMIEAAIRQSYKDGAHGTPEAKLKLLDALVKQRSRSDTHARVFAEWERSVGMKHPFSPS